MSDDKAGGQRTAARASFRPWNRNRNRMTGIGIGSSGSGYLLTGIYRLGQLDDKDVHTVMYRKKEVKRPSHGWCFFTGRSMMSLAHLTPHHM